MTVRITVFFLAASIALGSCGGTNRVPIPLSDADSAADLTSDGTLDSHQDSWPDKPDQSLFDQGPADQIDDGAIPPDSGKDQTISDVDSDETSTLPDVAPDLPPELITPPSGCCLSDTDCLDASGDVGLVCVWPKWGKNDFGLCMPKPQPPATCWNDSDCPGAQVCMGAHLCPCNADCDGLPEGPGVCVNPECPQFVGALADCPYLYSKGFSDDACVSYTCMKEPCKSDLDCVSGDGAFFGELCVLGNCVYCWQDSQCPTTQLCRAGRCVDKPAQCPYPSPCTGSGCKSNKPSEKACPVCACDTLYGIQCAEDMACQIFSFHKYDSCVYGRCADCRNDADCGNLGRCLPPGVCYETVPPIHELYGTWLIGWWGALNHYSYFRFEPDGTLRRGAYESFGGWLDDIPLLPCYSDEVFMSSPLVGTWEPEIT